MAKFFNHMDKNFNNLDMDRVADEIVQSGKHQIVIDGLTQMEKLLKNLKMRAAQLPE